MPENDLALRPSAERSTGSNPQCHDDVKMETFSALLAIWAGNSPVPHKGQWRGALIFFWSASEWTIEVNNREAGDLRRHRTHYYVTVMFCSKFLWLWIISHRICGPGPLFSKLTDVLCEVWKPRDSDLNFSNRSEIWHLGNSAVKMPIKFQSDTIITARERWGYITSAYGIQYLKEATFTLGVAPMKYLVAQGHRALPVVSNESVNPINPHTPINTSWKELILISTWNRQADEL